MYTRYQKANDLFTIDLLRGRDFGIGFYNKYRKVCGLPEAHKFEDFTDFIDHEVIEIATALYSMFAFIKIFYLSLINANYIRLEFKVVQIRFAFTTNFCIN